MFFHLTSSSRRSLPSIKKPKLNRDDPSNYRPISNLNNISKILERLFLARLQPHLISSPHYNPFQSAYRSCHSTETALTDPAQQNQTFCRPGGIHAPCITWSERCLRHHRSWDPTCSTSLDVWCWWNCFELAPVLSNPAVPIWEGRPGHLSIPIYSALVSHRDPCSARSFSLPSSPPFNLLPPISRLISNSTRMTLSFSSQFQKPTLSTRSACLEAALLHLTSWFYYNCLALNPEKSEAILLGTHARNKTLSNINQVDIAGSSIPLSDEIELLGVTIYSTLNFSKHVSLICQSCQYHIRALRHIRPILDVQTARLVGHALVSSRLDYANSILYGAPKSQIAKLQSQQNALARVVIKSSSGSARPLLQELHWLPMASRIEFKIAALTYKVLDSGLTILSLLSAEPLPSCPWASFV